MEHDPEVHSADDKGWPMMSYDDVIIVWVIPKHHSDKLPTFFLMSKLVLYLKLDDLNHLVPFKKYIYLPLVYAVNNDLAIQF